MNEKRVLMYEVLAELGIECTQAEEEDLNLQEFIEDSFSFINFIVSIEEKFNVEIPDEYLSYETIQSMNGLLELIETCGGSN